MPLELWKSVFDWATIIFIALTVFTGAGALITGDKLGKRQEEQLRQFDKDLTDAKAKLTKQQGRAVEAERSLLELRESISWRTPDRALIPLLASPLRQFAGQRFTIVSDLADPERMSVFTWINILLGEAHWTFETARSTSELTFQATNIVLWVSPNAPNGVSEAARALIPVLERGGLPAVVLKSGWGPEPDAAPPEVIRVVIFKKGPRMTVTGNLITFEGLPTRLFFGTGPPH
jgi:hypothetical protein